MYPEKHFMERLFTPEIAAFYEKFYADKGVNIKGENTVTALEGKDGEVGFPRCKPATLHTYALFKEVCPQGLVGGVGTVAEVPGLR